MEVQEIPRKFYLTESTPTKGDDKINWEAEARRAIGASKNWPNKSGSGEDYFRDLIKSGDVILDLGCQIAGTYGVFKDIESTIEYEGVDWSEEALKVARERYPDAKFYRMDARKIYFHERYDLVFTHTFYQHQSIESKKIIVPKVYKALKPGGYHVIQENTMGSCSGGGTGMSKEEYIDLFTKSGFELVKTHDIGGGGTGFVFRRPEQ